MSGDINQDGRLDGNDLAILRDLVKNPELAALLNPEDRALLDVNNDGQIDEQDIIALVKKIESEANQELAGVEQLRQKLRL